jgi:large subunit ribosomal protein L5
MARLYEKYLKEIRPALKKTFAYKNVMQIPRLEKVVINVGMGKATQDKAFLDEAVRDLALIAGQRPVKTMSKKAIASFKLRENQAIGCMVTLRGKRMYEFLDRLISIALPAVRDFRGVNTKLDGHGNYTLGWKDHTLFSEVKLDSVKNTFGFDICFVTTAKSDQEGRTLLTEFGMPFRKN